MPYRIQWMHGFEQFCIKVVHLVENDNVLVTVLHTMYVPLRFQF